MLSRTAVEEVCAATLLESYLSAVDEVPAEIQPDITRLFELQCLQRPLCDAAVEMQLRISANPACVYEAAKIVEADAANFGPSITEEALAVDVQPRFELPKSPFPDHLNGSSPSQIRDGEDCDDDAETLEQLTKLRDTLRQLDENADHRLQTATELHSRIENASQQIEDDVSHVQFAERTGKFANTSWPRLKLQSTIFATENSSTSPVATEHSNEPVVKELKPELISSSASRRGTSSSAVAEGAQLNLNRTDRKRGKSEKTADNPRTNCPTAGSPRSTGAAASRRRLNNSETKSSSSSSSSSRQRTADLSSSSLKRKRPTNYRSTEAATNSGAATNGANMLVEVIEQFDPNERTYCICQSISFGRMVKCDKENCPVEWFHFSCVNLESSPVGKWYCPQCRKKPTTSSSTRKSARHL